MDNGATNPAGGTGESDRAFFEREIVGLLDNLYGAALRLAKNRADAEDLVAEAVAKAWTHFAALKDRQCFRGWLFRILTNTFLTECRRHGETPLEDIADHADDTGEPAFSLFEQLHQPFLLWWSNPEEEFLNKVLRADIERAVIALPEGFRTVVILSDLEGFKYQEIAEMLNLPVGTVRSRLSRGRSLLQKALWQQAQAAGLSARAPDAQNPPEPLSEASEAP